jgi:hypothetical protein
MWKTLIGLWLISLSFMIANMIWKSDIFMWLSASFCGISIGYALTRNDKKGGNE